MIRYTFKYLKSITLSLSVIFLFQCSMVYDKRPVTIREAVNVNHKKIKRVKIEMDNGENLIANSIYYKDKQLYYSKKIKSREKIENSELYKSKSYMAQVKIEED